MATGKAGQEVVTAAAQTSRRVGFNKYTVQPTGIWARINRLFAVDPNRSTGVPLTPLFRNPPPGGNDPTAYDDPTTVPAADLADNPYWKRDVRRSYPKQSFVRQPDVVGLLSVGSAAQPKEDVLQVGDAGQKQLVEVRDEGERGLSEFFKKDKAALKGVLGPDGMPPLPTSMHPTKKQYQVMDRSEQAYGDSYPCRTFI